MNKFARKYRNEIIVLLTAFLFAAIGDLLYGGVEGAKASLVGVVLGSVSNLFFTIFFIMVLVTLAMKFFRSNAFYGTVCRLSEPSQTKPRAKRKK